MPRGKEVDRFIPFCWPSDRCHGLCHEKRWGNTRWMTCEPQSWCEDVWPRGSRMGKESAWCVAGDLPETWCICPHRWSRMVLGHGHFYPLPNPDFIEDLRDAPGSIYLSDGRTRIYKCTYGIKISISSYKMKTMAEHLGQRSRDDQQTGNDLQWSEKETYRTCWSHGLYCGWSLVTSLPAYLCPIPCS